jgi:intracellular septation protein A
MSKPFWLKGNFLTCSFFSGLGPFNLVAHLYPAYFNFKLFKKLSLTLSFILEAFLASIKELI